MQTPLIPPLEGLTSKLNWPTELLMKEKESDEDPYTRDPSHPSSPPGPCSEQNVTFPKSWTEFSKVADEKKRTWHRVHLPNLPRRFIKSNFLDMLTKKLEVFQHYSKIVFKFQIIQIVKISCQKKKMCAWEIFILNIRHLRLKMVSHILQVQY